MKRLLIFTLMLFSVVHITAQECDKLDSEWLNPSPSPFVYNYGSARLTGIPDAENSNNPTDTKIVFEGFTSPNPGVTPVGGVSIGLGFLNDPNDNIRFDVMVYNDNSGKPGTAVGGITGLSPTAIGVTHSFKEIWIEIPSLPVPTTSRFYVGVVMHPGDASDELVVLSNKNGEGNGDASNSITTTKFGNEKLLNTYTRDVDLMILPKLGVIEDASFSYGSSSYCYNGADPSATITGDTGGTFTSSPGGLVMNSSTGRIDLSISTPGTYTVRYTTNGSCPVSATRTVTVVNDTPVISCPTNKTININGATTTTVPDYRAMATVSDSCDPSPVVTQSPAPGTVVALGNHTITLTATDAASNVDNCTFNLLVRDVTAPTVIISSTVINPTNGVFSATFTFSEDVTGFVIGDITLGNATASNFSQTSASVYTADITPTTDGTATIDVAANAAEDAATNGNTAATQFSVEADFTAPTVTISSAVADPTDGAFSATFTFSENVTGFLIGDITLGNATASNFSQTSASVYTADITPTTDGTVTIDVAANVAEDAATNGNTAATQFSVEADLTNPDVTITSSVAAPTNGTFTATFTFSEDITGFVVGDITLGNATASNFNQTSASVYTADITPTADATITIDVAANVAEDAATNGNTAATQFTVEADLTDPGLTITSSVADPTNGAFAATFTFSEAVTGFALGDITLGNATASNFLQTSASVYTADITPTTDGTVTIDVAANVAEDVATNGNSEATQFSVEADLTDPDVTITSAVADPTNGTFSATFTFSEDVTGFVIGNITLGNASASNFIQTSPSVYTADITPTTDGTVTIDIAANVAEDAATNGNTAATQFSVEADLTNPDVTITSTVADPTNGTFTATFTFSEDVTGFVIGDITLGNATASNFNQTSASVYTADITPTTDGTVTVDVAANVAEDGATNGNTAATQFSVEADLTNPDVTITSTVADPTNGTFTATFTFSEDVTGFVIGDITLGNATASNFNQTSASVYTADITPTTDGTVTVDVAANVAKDGATNGNTAATQFSVEADLTNPGVTITSAVADPTNGTFTATFTFSEDVTGFVIGDITVGNGTASNFSATSASVYTADITPTTDGTVTVDVAANVAEDGATNGNTAATQFSVEADLTNPDVTITSTVPDPTNNTFTATFTFSEDVTGFTVGDITVGNGTASNFSVTSASVYTADITPTTDGTVTVDVAANVAEDAATNGNSAATQFSVEADLTNPDVTITSAVADPTNGTFTATFTFSEDVTGFVIGDITLGNATASNFSQTSASVYTADIIPTTDGTITIDVAANVAEDAATNGNSAATQFSVEADFTAPTVTISSSVADPTNATFTTTFTFSEDVTGFVIGDITLGNATASNFTQSSASVYTADITPTTDGTVTIDVAANVAEDAATNGNTAATQFNVQADYSTPTLIIDSGVNGLTNKAFTTTFTFSEAVTGFAIGDITLGNATTTRFSQATPLVYTAEITPTTDGIVTVDVAANVAEDAATNGNTAAPQHSVMADFTAPEVSIGNIPAELNDFDPFSLTFTFTEEVVGFEDSDIQLTNAQLKSFTTTDNIVFEVSLSAISNDEVTVSVPANTLDDLAGNPFEGAEQLTITFNSLPTDISLSVLSIDENNTLGDEIGQFSTADNDLGDVHAYSLVTGTGADDNNAFGITTDKLRAAEAFNFEAKSGYTIRVSTNDGRGGIFEKVFAITINDVNEQPTDILLSNQIIEETDEERISVGLLSTIDQDFGDDFSYELVEGNGSTHNARFAIVGDELFTSQMVNYEELEVLQIRVRTTDSGGLYFEKALEIAVVNVENEALRDFTKDEPDARIKNFFTPNGDGKNDVWVVDDIRDNPNNQVKVYSQNGQLVFSTNNYQNNWKGTYNGKQLPSGTYYYEINIANGMSIIKGTVLILTR
ncbi:Ig-like domain-containing protein [Roseivirga pacifica]|uniref:Ig-like domain-containing protein n=1 Tax=Roseivirga pacifica TaxID=1267423 RepID=UPI00227C2341|nr:Ig-like domain-containing protein [Roseivirga pacifica]